MLGDGECDVGQRPRLELGAGGGVVRPRQRRDLQALLASPGYSLRARIPLQKQISINTATSVMNLTAREMRGISMNSAGTALGPGVQPSRLVRDKQLKFCAIR